MKEYTFGDLGLSPKLLSILEKLKFTTPTQIQHEAIPVALEGKDVIGIAQTGTGKTLAFSLPLLQQIARSKKQGLIVLPTRELAQQVDEELKKIGRSFGLKTALLIGGAPIWNQKKQIVNRPHVIVGTPGRINDHLQQRTLNLSSIGVFVLDEADRMLDMGFAPQIRDIAKTIPRERQTMLFSATMPREIMNMVNQYMVKPVEVRVSVAGTVTEKVNQELFVVAKHQKNQLLDKVLDDHEGTALVFSRTKYGAKRICRAVQDMGHSAAEMHSNLSLGQRRRALEGFKSGKFRVLVATDIAARGIDVTNIQLVVNYDLPDNPDDYVHRVGRTGRAGKDGKAISFVTTDQRRELDKIERSVQQRFEISDLPQLPPVRPNSKGNGYRTEEKRFSHQHKRTTFKYARPKRQNSKQSRGQKHSDKTKRTIRVHS